ncbi:MAG: 2-amino-4-hydroxy-6-hydroxymethyldihydropteridine diphosphokinase [Bacteroidia bacterium]|nr:2-amino-4-hydroxy-6-hydroxymethyldihydropteridine diphosphokinase [Bacteroidia bacterium]MBL4716810.1 2-amino-4-hydroxy-6-hydroxymethyldihydropteridine diphosphokinase [Bacteroidia bacterium]
MSIVYLLLGGNLGNRENNLSQTLTLIEKDVGYVQKSSSIYETAPWGIEDQPLFLNQCLQITTTLSPEILLKTLKKIEDQIGRKARDRWHAREIDIDILFYDDLIHADDLLTIPHAKLHERRFTLMPLQEIAASYIHPKLNRTISQLLDECKDSLEVNIYRNEEAISNSLFLSS